MLTFFGSYEELDKKSTLEIPTVSACINKIADTVSRLPVKLYRKADGEISEITDDFRLKLLNGETGDTLSTVDLWKSAIEDYFVGKGAWIFINSDGLHTKSLHYVSNDFVSILPNTDPIFKAFHVLVNGRKYFDFQFIRLLRKTKNGWDNIPIQAENSAILSASYNSLKLENTMSANGGCKSGFLKLKSKISKEAIEEIRKNYTLMYDNTKQRDRKVPVLNDGIEFQEISATAAELQLNENKKANSVEICKIFGFPHTVIDGGATEDDNKKFISAVIALLNQIETALDSSLLLESEKENGYYWAFDTKELTRGSLRERYEAYDIAVKNNILQVDEIRKEEDYAPMGFNYIKLGLGDVFYNPVTKSVFTPNTGQTANLETGEVYGENRAETELRGRQWIKGEHGYFAGSVSTGGGGSAGGVKSEKGLDNSQKSDIIKENSNKKPITEITDSAIESVPNVKISGYTDEQCAEIQRQHKELLQYSRDNNNGNEVAFVLDSNLQNRKEFKGSDDRLDFGSSLYGKDLTVMHNHPRNSSYSNTDIIFFGSNSNVKTLTIVKNNGKIEYLTKGKEFDGKTFKLEYDRLYKKIVKSGTDSEKTKFVKTLLSKTKSGVIWSERE